MNNLDYATTKMGAVITLVCVGVCSLAIILAVALNNKRINELKNNQSVIYTAVKECTK